MADTPRRAIALGSDHAGYPLKTVLADVLSGEGFLVLDLGCSDDTSCDYPDFGHAVARAIKQQTAEVGLLVCGTGVGMGMAANRHAGVRAVVCSDTYSARMAREHNDANVVCLGARVVGTGLAAEILHAFLEASFEGGRHARRVHKIEP